MALRAADQGGPKPSEIQDLDDKLADAKEFRRPSEGQSFLNIAFYLGKQWLMWDGNRLYEPDLGDMSTPVDNRIRPIVRTAIAKETKQRPTFVAAPHSLDEDDINGALLSEEVFDYEWDDLELTRKLRSALWWRRLTGAGWWKVTWDKTKGDSVDVYTDSQGGTLLDSSGRPMRTNRDDINQVLEALPPEARAAMQTQNIAMGDVRVDVPTWFAMFADPYADDSGVSSADFLIEEGIAPLERMRGEYPDFADKLYADAAPGSGSIMERLPGFNRRDGRKTGVKRRELWAKPCNEYPQGRRVVWACNTILVDEPNPYGWLPYVMFRGDPSGGFWPDAPVTPLISPQIRLNKREAQIDDNADRFGNPPLAYPDGMELDEWQGLPGEHLRYPALGTPDAVPSFLNVPEVPAYVQNEVDRMVAALRDISGQHEVTSGNVPAGVTAASAINLLLEQDDTQIGPDVVEMENALSEAGFRVLWLIGKYVTDERLLKIAGEDGDWDLPSFRGDQLQRPLQRARRRPAPGCRAPRRPSRQRCSSLLDMLLKYGGPEAINARSLRRYLRDMEAGGLERMFADIDVDETKVIRENRRLMMAEQVPVHDFDNHQFEIEAHNEARKSRRYEQTVAANPDVAAVFEQHVMAHMAELAKQMAPPPPAGVNAGSQETVPPDSPQNGGPPAAVPSQ
jgi:hypothetical protein